MKTQILITGGRGFIGSHLAAYLRARGQDILISEFDLTQYEQIETELRNVGRLDIVIHLAGVSSIAEAESNIEQALNVNVAGTLRLLECLQRLSFRGHFIFASTGQVYRGHCDNVSYNEESPVAPTNIYSRTKFAAEGLCRQYSEGADFSSTVLRFFNHSHKDQVGNIFLPSIYRQLQQIQAGAPAELKVGNVDVDRDFSSLQSLCAKFAMVCAEAPASKYEIFNICSGVPRRLRTLINILAEEMKLKVQIQTDPARVRAQDQLWVVGDTRKFNSAYNYEGSKSESDVELIRAYLADFDS